MEYKYLSPTINNCTHSGNGKIIPSNNSSKLSPLLLSSWIPSRESRENGVEPPRTDIVVLRSNGKGINTPSLVSKVNHKRTCLSSTIDSNRINRELSYPMDSSFSFFLLSSSSTSESTMTSHAAACVPPTGDETPEETGYDEVVGYVMANGYASEMSKILAINKGVWDGDELAWSSLVNYPYGPQGKTRLMWRILTHDIQGVKRMIRAGAKLNQRCGISLASTPLIIACFEGNPDIVSLLVNHGAKISERAIFQREICLTNNDTDEDTATAGMKFRKIIIPRPTFAPPKVNHENFYTSSMYITKAWGDITVRSYKLQSSIEPIYRSFAITENGLAYEKVYVRGDDSDETDESPFVHTMSDGITYGMGPILATLYNYYHNNSSSYDPSIPPLPSLLDELNLHRKACKRAMYDTNSAKVEIKYSSRPWRPNEPRYWDTLEVLLKKSSDKVVKENADDFLLAGILIRNPLIVEQSIKAGAHHGANTFKLFDITIPTVLLAAHLATVSVVLPRSSFANFSHPANRNLFTGTPMDPRMVHIVRLLCFNPYKPRDPTETRIVLHHHCLVAAAYLNLVDVCQYLLQEEAADQNRTPTKPTTLNYNLPILPLRYETETTKITYRYRDLGILKDVELSALAIAVFSHNTELVRLFVQQEFSTLPSFHRTDALYTAILHSAAWNNDLAILKILIEIGKLNIHCTHSSRVRKSTSSNVCDPLLYHAEGFTYASMLHPTDEQDSLYCPILLLAILQGHKLMVQYIIDQGAVINNIDIPLSPFNSIREFQRMNITYEPNKNKNDLSLTLLQAAILSGDIDIFRTLMRTKSVSIRNSSKISMDILLSESRNMYGPLFIACGIGTIAIAKELIDIHKLPANERIVFPADATKNEHSADIMSKVSRNGEIARVNINCKSISVENGLHFTIKIPEVPCNYPPVRVTNSTPLWMSCRKHNPFLVPINTSSYSDPFDLHRNSLRGFHGKYPGPCLPAQYFAQSRNYDRPQLVIELLERGADPAMDDDNQISLYHAVCTSNRMDPRILQVLLRYSNQCMYNRGIGDWNFLDFLTSDNLWTLEDDNHTRCNPLGIILTLLDQGLNPFSLGPDKNPFILRLWTVWCKYLANIANHSRRYSAELFYTVDTFIMDWRNMLEIMRRTNVFRNRIMLNVMVSILLSDTVMKSESFGGKMNTTTVPFSPEIHYILCSLFNIADTVPERYLQFFTPPLGGGYNEPSGICRTVGSMNSDTVTLTSSYSIIPSRISGYSSRTLERYHRMLQYLRMNPLPSSLKLPVRPNPDYYPPESNILSSFPFRCVYLRHYIDIFIAAGASMDRYVHYACENNPNDPSYSILSLSILLGPDMRTKPWNPLTNTSFIDNEDELDRHSNDCAEWYREKSDNDERYEQTYFTCQQLIQTETLFVRSNDKLMDNALSYAANRGYAEIVNDLCRKEIVYDPTETVCDCTVLRCYRRLFTDRDPSLSLSLTSDKCHEWNPYRLEYMMDVLIDNGLLRNNNAGGYSNPTLYELLHYRYHLTTQEYEILINKGIDMHGTVMYSRSILMHPDLSPSQLRYFLEKSDQVSLFINYRDDWNRTALYYWCKRGNIAMVEVLLKYNADVSISDCNGKIPLMAVYETINEIKRANKRYVQMGKQLRRNNILELESDKENEFVRIPGQKKGYAGYKTVSDIQTDKEMDDNDTDDNASMGSLKDYDPLSVGLKVYYQIIELLKK